MNKFAKTSFLILLLSVIPTYIWAQDYSSNHAKGSDSHVNAAQKVDIRDYENGFLFNVFEIANVEERVQLAAALATSDIWLCNPTDNPGELFIRPNSYNANIPIYAEFDYLRMTLREEYENASLLPKEEYTEIFESWAHSISREYYNFLISDHLDRANHCMDAEPFCTSDVYNFPALNSGYSWSGPNYGCLGSSPTNKHSFWYYMRIGVAGNITIKIEAGFDVDFALWGPFSNETDPCPTGMGQEGLLSAECSGYSCPNNTEDPYFYPSGNLHDCSYDARHFEYAHVVNGQVGQYFILLITNYSGSSGDITFQKYSGDGETDCGIMPGIVSNGGPYCEGETIQLTVNAQNNATYSWTGPNGWTSNLQNPTRPNCTIGMSGTYTCTTIVGAQQATASTEVLVYQQATPSFTANTVCQGEPTQFNGQASGDNLVFEWNFGDNTPTSNQQNPSHTYAQAGTYDVTLHIEAEDGSCPAETTQLVTVYAQPVANAGPDQTIGYGATAQLDGTGGVEDFLYLWEPEDLVVNPYSATTQTVALTQDTTFRLTVTNPLGDCIDSDEVTIFNSGSAMSATATANPLVICKGQESQISANPVNGTGNYTYSWTSIPDGFTSTLRNIVVTPEVTTEYRCTVSDSIDQDHIDHAIISITVTVNQPDFMEDVYLKDSCNSVHVTWQGQDTVFYANTTYKFIGETEEGCYREQTYHIVDMMYTPQPEIISADPNIENPHYPITATEFNVNRYTYTVTDNVSDIDTWNNDQCAWTISKKTWHIVPSDDRLSCTVYAMDWVEDTIWLMFTAVNPCTGGAEDTVKYWLKPSFYGIDDNESYPASVSVLPNPNNGQMEFRVNNMEGSVAVKVFNTVGLPVDQFEFKAQQGPNSYSYTMKPLPNGVYYFVFTNGKRSITKKVVIIH